MPECVAKAASHLLGRSDTPTLTQIVTAFRGTRATLGREGLGKAGAQSRLNKKRKLTLAQTNSVSCSDVCEAVLIQHGYPIAVIWEALAKCGPDLKAAVEYCLQQSATATSEVPVPDGTVSSSGQSAANFVDLKETEVAPTTMEDPVTEDVAAHNLMVEMGFPVNQITLSLIHI